MFVIKRAIVRAMERACGILDRIPRWERDTEGRLVCCYGYFGCGLTRLAYHSADLDERWNTGVWT